MRKNIYCDMDGVLADFNNEYMAKERFETEKGFFFKLKPIIKNVETIQKLLNDKNYKIRIITASPNKEADQDKLLWLETYFPELDKKDIIICRNGQKKVKFMKSRKGILFDDYGKNIREWQTKKGNIAFKISEQITIQDYLDYSL